MPVFMLKKVPGSKSYYRAQNYVGSPVIILVDPAKSN
jgi:hypothetical protein